MIGLLVVMAIIIVAVWFVWIRPHNGVEQKPRFEGEAQTPLGQALQKGQSVECQQYLLQLRSFIRMEKDSTGEYPAALDPKWGLPLKCSVSGQPFGYDPASGRVWDPTPGHEKF